MLYETSLQVGGLLGAIVLLVALVVVLELGQYLVARSVYFGTDQAVPFYVLGYRSGAAGLLGIGIVSDYLELPSLTVLGAIGSLLSALALVLLLAAAGIQSTPTGAKDARRSGSLGRGILLETLGLLLLGFGPLGGDLGVLIAAVAISGGSAGLYLTRRDDVLGTVRPPPSATAEAGTGGRFARRDR